MTATPEALAPVIAAVARLPPVARLLGDTDRCSAPAAPGRAVQRLDIGGLWSSSASIVAGLSACSGRGRVVVICPSAEAAEATTLDLGQLFPELPLAHLPVAEEALLEGPERRANRSERLVALTTLLEPGDGALVVPGPVLLEHLPATEGPLWVVEKGARLDREKLLVALADHDFARVPLVAAPGEVSVRGDIIDIYPWAAETPLRIELFDDEVEDLRRFEVDSQRSVAALEQVTLRLGSGAGQRRRFTELLAADTTLLLLDPPQLRDRLIEVAFERGQAPREVEALLDRLARQPGADLHPLDIGRSQCDVSLRAVQRLERPLEQLLAEWLDDGRTVTLLHDSEGERDRLAASLIDRGLRAHERLHLAVGRVTAGFSLPHGGPLLLHHHELIGRRAVRRRRPGRIVASRALDSLSELAPGNHVVHLLHGVARFRGMKRLAREQGEEDFLVLEFAEDTLLYVPASRIDLVERFIGGDGAGPRLDRLGGKTWARKKAKVAAAVEDLAAQLLQLQAHRSGGQGFAHPPDEAAQLAFESTFPYEDTPDQRSAWEDVRRDMESPRPADRLIVGDVGFGKTEVAVRAAYKTVLAGKQAAVLVPTTILAEQHHDTFRHRMAEEPLRIEVLSRLRGGKKVKAMLDDLAAGRVDILIGTHRLLGKEVAFADLGLVIVDEEQRFGVTHKERLKQLKASVDVVTLSATPIPRTLHMAMSGLRDISTIATPPPGRLPVITRVAYDTDEIVRDAVRHEVNRGGQVYVLHNRVQSLARTLQRIRQLVPHARAAFAHGQMAARELTRIIETFAAGELDVLVCTTIIESGIDIPRANTIIVTDSQRYGLADMHQLRGRVGRENRQAYALFLMPRGKLPPSTVDRLKAIEEFNSLDAGLTIALRDLELRGAGNLLGAEQSGQIMAVGYDTYCRLLRNAVAAAKGRPVEKEPGEIEVDLGSVAFLPADYVPDEPTRMALLRRLASAGRKHLTAIELELVDRFGPLPEPAAELLRLFELRRLVRLAGVGSLLTDGLGGMVLTIRDEAAFERRQPFRPHEIHPVTPLRIRVPWPATITTASQRLSYLIERFGSQRAKAGAR